MSNLRLQIIKQHIHPQTRNDHYGSVKLNSISASGSGSDSSALSLTEALHSQLYKDGIHHVEMAGPPKGSNVHYRTIVTPEAVTFVSELVQQFSDKVEEILNQRQMTKLSMDVSGELPDFPKDIRGIRRGSWQVGPVPPRLRCRHVDLGDVSPSNTQHFLSALKSTAQGIQTDLDDGHCPTWSNQLLSLFNIHQAAHNLIPGVPKISQAPVLMLRPRAWNMIEHNMLVSGKEVAGPLFDFGMLMFHNAAVLIEAQSGPFFYLPKLESHKEAKLWNDIFVWTQHKLGIPVGTVKACVLVENVLASFEMDEILYELRDHSAGLNCGMWDYSASFVNKFGHRRDFVLPDRSKYVSMERHFLKSYMDLVIQTCHRRAAPATGGMAAPLLPQEETGRRQVTQVVCRAKQKEIESGADGFMVYDLGLVQPTQDLFRQLAPGANQLHKVRPDVTVTAQDLLQMPPGGVTLQGLKHNIGVGILFIYAWLSGTGHYYFKGAVEDSATAEISRSQVWQWIRHQATLEDNGEVITRHMVQKLADCFVQDTLTAPGLDCSLDVERCHLVTASGIFMEIVLKQRFPEFITTYLNHEHTFLKTHGM